MSDREKLIEAGNALADAVRGLDSYATSTQWAPLERSERADAALKAWEALAALPTEPEQEGLPAALLDALERHGLIRSQDERAEPVRATDPVSDEERSARNTESLGDEVKRLRVALKTAREALEYVLDHHLDGCECACSAARSVAAAGLSLTEDKRRRASWRPPSDREPEPPTVPMLRDGNGWVDPYVKLRQRDAELEELCDEIDRLKAEPVRATDPARAALREAAEWLWQCHDALMRGEDDPGIGDAWNALRAALAADREPEPVGCCPHCGEWGPIGGVCECSGAKAARADREPEPDRVCPRCGGSGETVAYPVCPVCDGDGVLAAALSESPPGGESE